jgi:hypothetical protein
VTSEATAAMTLRRSDHFGPRGSRCWLSMCSDPFRESSICRTTWGLAHGLASRPCREPPDLSMCVASRLTDSASRWPAAIKRNFRRPFTTASYTSAQTDLVVPWPARGPGVLDSKSATQR